jgi:uncharacterized protein with HEPN domain
VNRDEVFLHHILDEIYFLEKQTKSLEFEDFLSDPVLQRAVSRSLEIIGEASKNISIEFKNANHQIEWTKAAGLRDKLIHHYFGVEWDIIWNVIYNELPLMGRKIELILNQEK